MNDEQILKKAIGKAVDNGFYQDNFYNYRDMSSKGSEYTKEDFANSVANKYRGKLCWLIIFSHDFAKAFWGTKRMYYEGVNADKLINNKLDWQFHLQQMVLEKHPLKYLEKFL